MIFLTAPTDVDWIFFGICLAVVLLCIGIYYLIPVIKKRQFAEQRANLQRREKVFRENLKVEEVVSTNLIDEEETA